MSFWGSGSGSRGCRGLRGAAAGTGGGSREASNGGRVRVRASTAAARTIFRRRRVQAGSRRPGGTCSGGGRRRLGSLARRQRRPPPAAAPVVQPQEQRQQRSPVAAAGAHLHNVFAVGLEHHCRSAERSALSWVSGGPARSPCRVECRRTLGRGQVVAGDAACAGEDARLKGQVLQPHVALLPLLGPILQPQRRLQTVGERVPGAARK